jgi:hypothetical protein
MKAAQGELVDDLASHDFVVLDGKYPRPHVPPPKVAGEWPA